MHADSRSLSVTLSFASRCAAAEFFLRRLIARSSLAAQAALAMVDRGEAPDWGAANAAAAEAHRASCPAEGTFPQPRVFAANEGGVVWRGRGRSELLLRGAEVTIGPRGDGPHLAPEEVADAIAGRLLGGLAPWQQTDERKALTRKILALWAKDRKERAAAADRAAEEERLARRSGLTVAAYRERLARAARRSGRAGVGGKRNWTARRSA